MEMIVPQNYYWRQKPLAHNTAIRVQKQWQAERRQAKGQEPQASSKTAQA